MASRKRTISLFVKLTLTFLAILVLLGVIQLALSARGWLYFVQESQQRLFHPIASSIARRIEPFTADGLKLAALEEELEQYLAPPQLFDLYVLDQSGNVVYHSSSTIDAVASQISLRPIEQFLAEERLATGAIFGQNPLAPEEEIIFSAAPLTLSGTPGYLYVVLDGLHYQSILDVLGRSYFLQVSLLGLLLSLAAAALVGVLSFFFLTKPLKSVTTVIAEFARGNYSARAEIDTQDELRELSDTMNVMAGVIEQQFEALEAKDRLRRELIANISHDLKTPLTSLGGTIEAELHRFEERSREELRDAFERAYKNFRFTKTLVSELFELSTLEARVRAPDFAPIPIDELIEDTVAGLGALAAEKKQSLLWELPEALPPARGDFAMISKVIVNLLQNALRYTPEEGKIVVKANSDAQRVEVVVEDTGPGIAADELPNVFKRFYRVSDNGRSSEPGTGLGLAIVKEIMDLHETEIIVESEVGVGSSFRFSLSRADAL